MLSATGCPGDDSEGDESEGMASESNSEPTTNTPSTDSASESATETPSTDTAAANDDSDVELGCAADGVTIDTTDGATDPLMETWGASCTSNEECVALLGDGAICETVAVVYELPGGYCTKPCTLPDTNTRVVLDDPTCDPAGGVACIGQQPLFERCAKICTDDTQCNRAGYECRQMPVIAQEGDPSSCLMPDCCETEC